ncbi:MAG: hypothetical protein ACRDTH_13790 [Pseudonocardiaceae bacterium]
MAVSPWGSVSVERGLPQRAGGGVHQDGGGFGSSSRVGSRKRPSQAARLTRGGWAGFIAARPSRGLLTFGRSTGSEHGKTASGEHPYRTAAGRVEA